MTYTKLFYITLVLFIGSLLVIYFLLKKPTDTTGLIKANDSLEKVMSTRKVFEDSLSRQITLKDSIINAPDEPKPQPFVPVKNAKMLTPDSASRLAYKLLHDN